MLIKHCASHLN
jgi:hypothetical protein